MEPNAGASPANTIIIRLHLFSFLLFLPLAFKVEFVSFLNGDPILYRFLFPAPNVFQIPHSLSLDENNGRLFVADRENSRVLVFETHQGKLLGEIKDFGERVFAVHYHPEQGNLDTFWVLLTGSFQMKLKFPDHKIRK